MNARRFVGLTLLLFCFTLSAPTRADEKAKEEKKKKREVYSAVAMGVAGVPAGRTLSLTIYIDGYTTDEEATQLAETLKTHGSDAVLKAMEKLNKGRIAPVGRTGNSVAIIRTRPADNGKRRIILVTDRPIGFIELRQGTRSRDYEFGVIELLLDEKGRGEGVALAAAKIKFTSDNTIQVEHYGIEPVRLVNVRAF